MPDQESDSACNHRRDERAQSVPDHAIRVISCWRNRRRRHRIIGARRNWRRRTYPELSVDLTERGLYGIEAEVSEERCDRLVSRIVKSAVFRCSLASDRHGNGRGELSLVVREQIGDGDSPNLKDDVRLRLESETLDINRSSRSARRWTEEQRWRS